MSEKTKLMAWQTWTIMTLAWILMAVTWGAPKAFLFWLGGAVAFLLITVVAYVKKTESKSWKEIIIGK
ncbi:MAG: hypothetical protein V1857_04120 [archaeon]